MDNMLPCRELLPMNLFKKTLKMCTTKSTAIPRTKLNEINDDCLEYIFNFLDIYDLYALARVSSRFETVFSLFNRKFVYTVADIATPNLHHFLKTVGMQIRTLNVTIKERSSSEVIAFFECVQQYCPNVKHLAIKKWPHLNFSRYSTMLKRLKSLRLDECEYTEMNDLLSRRFVGIKPWVAQPGLCSMQLSLQKSTGMSDLTSLTTLKLHRCNGLSLSDFQEFLAHNQHLNELSLHSLKEFNNSDAADESFFDNLAQHLQSVQTISIDVYTTSFIQFIARLPQLRSLQLIDYTVCNDRIVDRLLRKLCETNTVEELDLYHCNLGLTTYRVISQFEKLHTLKLQKHFWVSDQHLASLNQMQSLKKVCFFDSILLNDDAVMSLVRVAPQLTHLDCSWCYKVTNRTIYDIQYLLHHQTQRPKLEILVGGRTKIAESVLNDIPKEDADRFSIKFDPNMPITYIIQNSFCLNCVSKETT